MSKQANKTLIGGFVIGAVAIVVAGILIFGSGRLLTEKRKFVLFFDGSVKGLNVGAPVQLKGVTIGRVNEIMLLADPKTLEFYNEVIIEVLPDKISKVGTENTETKLSQRDSHLAVKMLISKGLRAKLEMISFVTGQLQVAFNFYPDTEVRKVGFNTEYDELPTLPSDMETMTKKLEKIPIEELVEEALATVETVNKLVGSPRVKSILANLDQTLQDIDTLTKKLDRQVVPLTRELTGTVRDTRQFVNNLNQKADPVSDEILKTLKSASAMFDQTNAAGGAIYQLLEEDSDIHYSLREALLELSSVSRSIRVLADYLEQHPEALLKGKPGGN